jgi:chloramphenicol-sensitive protein RarD
MEPDALAEPVPVAAAAPTAGVARGGSSGVVYALAAYTSWGVLPVYWKNLAAVSPFEILLVRIAGTAAFACLLVTAARRWHEVRAALRRRRSLAALVASALLIASNWLAFLWAVDHGEILATSLGYYLNPLANVVLGVGVLRERLRPLQLGAVLLAAVGVAYLAVASGGLPWLSLFLALSFALYGLIRKTVAVGPIPGLAIETGLLAPVAVLVVAARSVAGIGALAHPGRLPQLALVLLAGAGAVTALPLVWFASAARRLRLATVGLFQYIAPTLALAVAVLLYGEPFTSAHAVAFACIWTALALYSAESLRSIA